MDKSNPSTTEQEHLATLPPSSSSTMSPPLISSRTGVENMDGQAILAAQTNRSRARPWPGCIPSSQLTRDNLPPFYVRLQDEQVGHLSHWVGTSRASITRIKLGQVWPWDFDVQGRILARRESWGAEYGGEGKEKAKGLGGAKKVPTFVDSGLPLTYTSSHKIMIGELDALEKGADLKRKAEEEAGLDACMPVKKPRLGSMSTELKKIKEATNKQRQNDKLTEREQERFSSAAPELRDAMQVVDTLMRSATETSTQNATLEAMLLQTEAHYVQNTDDMFDEWLAYSELKRKEADRMHQDHAAEIERRDATIAALETDARGSSARLRRERRRVRVRDGRLAGVKRRWVREQELVGERLRDIEEAAVEVDELSEFDCETDESEGEESDCESELEEAKEEARVKNEKGEAKEALKQERLTPTEQRMRDSMDGKLKRRMAREQRNMEREQRCMERERIKSMDPKEMIHSDLDEDEDNDSDVAPLSS